MEALNEVIKKKDLVKAKKIFTEMMEEIKKGLVETEKKIVGASIEEDTQPPAENPDDESEDNPSTKNKVDSSQPDNSTQAA